MITGLYRTRERESYMRMHANTVGFRSQFFDVVAMNHCTQKEYLPMLNPFSYEEIIVILLYAPRLVGNRSASVLSLIQQATFLDDVS
jgi:hypothetical protein